MSEQMPTHHALNERVAEIQAAGPNAAQMNAQVNQNLAIEARGNSQEVRLLNDAAEIAIFGSKGQIVEVTARHNVKTIDPATGKFAVDSRTGADIIQSVEKTNHQIVKGKLVQLREAGKNTEADKYQADVLELVDEGFVLSQAKLIMDGRASRANANRKEAGKASRLEGMLTKQYIKNGDAPDVAEAKAKARVAGKKSYVPDDSERGIRRTRLNHSQAAPRSEVRIDREKNKRRKSATEQIDIRDKAEDNRIKGLIKSRGIFTAEELKRVLDPTTPPPAPPTVPLSPAEAARRKATNERELRSLVRQVQYDRNDYARRSAGRGRRTLVFGEDFTEESVAQARSVYESTNAQVRRGDLIRHEYKMALEAGVSPEDLNNYAGYFAAGDVGALTRELYKERLLATESYKEDGHGNLDKIQPKTAFGKATEAFYKFWGKRDGAKLLSWATVEKSAALAVPATLIGVPAALVGSVLLAPIAGAGGAAFGAFAAGRIAKGKLAHRVSERGRGVRYIDELDQELEDLEAGIIRRTNAAHARGAYVPGIVEPNVLDTIDAQTRDEVHGNRTRLGWAVGAGALGAAGAELAGHALGLGHHHHSSTKSKGSSGRGTTPPPATPPPAAQPPQPPYIGGGGSGYPQDPSVRLSGGGDSVYHEVQQYMNTHGYDGNDGNAVTKVTGATLQAAHENWDTAYGFQPGRNFKIPRAVLEQLLKKQ
jgi:hypothetical protein